MKNNALLILMSLFFLYCEEPVTPDEITESFIGTWVHKEHIDDVRILERKDKLQLDRGGYIFNNDNTLTDRKNAGWCGTPPIEYENFKGGWIKINEDRLKIVVGYWGGIDKFDVEIINLTESELRLRYVQ